VIGSRCCSRRGVVMGLSSVPTLACMASAAVSSGLPPTCWRHSPMHDCRLCFARRAQRVRHFFTLPLAASPAAAFIRGFGEAPLCCCCTQPHVHKRCCLRPAASMVVRPSHRVFVLQRVSTGAGSHQLRCTCPTSTPKAGLVCGPQKHGFLTCGAGSAAWCVCSWGCLCTATMWRGSHTGAGR
jgi:hypothetical protein